MQAAEATRSHGLTPLPVQVDWPKAVRYAIAVRQDDLDSYWLDTRNWYWYGYRPYTKVHISRYAPSLPTWYAGSREGCSFGMNETAGNAPWEGGPPTKFQLTKYGTWH